jgi:hypothetical protein
MSQEMLSMPHSLSSLLCILCLISACQQPLAEGPRGEDPPPLTGRQPDQLDRDIAMAKQLQSGRMERTADPALQNIRVAYKVVDHTHEDYQRLAASFAYANDGVGVRSGGGLADNGFTVTTLGAHHAMGIGGTQRSGRSSSSIEQFIVVQNGSEGRIHIGQITPVIEEVVVVAGGRRRPVAVVTQMGSVASGAFLVVQPEIVDPERELIRLRVAPELSFLHAEGLDITSLMTELVVRNGQTLAIGGASSSARSVARTLLSSAAGSSSATRIILLTVSY